MTSKKPQLSIVSINHYIRLVYRSALFLWLLVDYIIYCLFRNEDFARRLEERPLVLGVIWIVFVVEMIRRFFPSGHESPGCRWEITFYRIPRGFPRTPTITCSVRTVRKNSAHTKNSCTRFGNRSKSSLQNAFDL